MNAWQANLEMIEIVARGLKELLAKVCFVGGATTVLYLDPAQSNAVRPTEDVDCVFELGTYLDYHQLGVELGKLGFEHSMKHGDPLCRFIYQKIKVDIMPNEGKILGFSNRWYSEGISSAEEKVLPSGTRIKVFSIPYFFAAKLEAFQDRGHHDYYGSKDLEDVITVLDGRKNLRQDFLKASQTVQVYLQEEFGRLLQDEKFLQSLTGHLSNLPDYKERTLRIIDVLKNI